MLLNHILGTSFICLLFVFVELPVKFTKPLDEETSAMKGQHLYLTCELNKERDVVWKRDGQVLKSIPGKLNINVIGMQHAITIQNSDESDAGLYTCEVATASGDIIDTKSTVKVIGKNMTFKD